jgi:hypothetical protein
MLGDLRLNEQGGLVQVDARCQILGGSHAGSLGYLSRVLRRGNRVHVRDEEECFVLILDLDPIDQCAQVVAKVQRISRWLHAGQDAGTGCFHGFP